MFAWSCCSRRKCRYGGRVDVCLVLHLGPEQGATDICGRARRSRAGRVRPGARARHSDSDEYRRPPLSTKAAHKRKFILSAEEDDGECQCEPSVQVALEGEALGPEEEEEESEEEESGNRERVWQPWPRTSLHRLASSFWRRRRRR